MKLKIMDYTGRKVETGVDFDNLKDVNRLLIRVVTGDEILTAVYRDGIKEYDSSTLRAEDYFDGRYILYYPAKGINRIAQFMRRKSSYDMFKWIEEGRA